MQVKYIIIHCTATRGDKDFSLEQLRTLHVKHNGWRDIGYNYYIRKDGTLHGCRPLTMPGAHTKGYNDCSIGVCYEGGLAPDGSPSDTRTAAQKRTLELVLRTLRHIYPAARICGHRDFSNKACPCFNAGAEYQDL